MINVGQTILSQYATSPTLVQLITNMNGYIDPSTNFDAFYNDIWNITTANGYGLDVWGRIVGVGRVLALTSELQFGFDEATTASAEPFNQGAFFSGTSFTSNFALGDPAYRTLILAKALANITDGSIPSINNILLFLFPDLGLSYCTDGLNMTMTYTLGAAPSAVELAIISQSGVLPRPCGVSVTVVHP